MLHLTFWILLYFLPAIIGRDKRDATGIFLLNLFLGWTVIGWVLALIWAVSAEPNTRVRWAPAAANARHGLAKEAVEGKRKEKGEGLAVRFSGRE